MSQESLDDTIKFRAGPLKEAATELDSVHLGGINISELAREGLTQMLQRSMTDDDKIAIYERYSAGDLSKTLLECFSVTSSTSSKRILTPSVRLPQTTPATISSKWLAPTHGINPRRYGHADRCCE